jgi:hypothetical protein
MGRKDHSPSPLVKCVDALKTRGNVAVAGLCTIAERIVRRKIGRGINRLVNNLNSYSHQKLSDLIFKILVLL